MKFYSENINKNLKNRKEQNALRQQRVKSTINENPINKQSSNEKRTQRTKNTTYKHDLEEFNKLKKQRLTQIHSEILTKELNGSEDYNVEEKKFTTNSTIMQDYIRLYDTNDVKDSHVLVESKSGKYLTSDIKALLPALYSNNSIEVIYFVYNNDAVIELNNILANAKVVLVKYESLNYYKVLTQAKYLINDGQFADFFIKKAEQVYLNLSNTQLYAHRGNDVITQFGKHAKMSKNILMSDILLSTTGDLETFLKAYGTFGLWNGTQYYCAPRYEIIDNSVTRQFVLFDINYTLSKEIFTKQIRHFVKLVSQKDNENFVLRIDPRNINWTPNEVKDFLVSRHMDQMSLLQATKIVITYNSSIIFDAAKMGIPIINYLEDYKFNILEQGSYLELEDLPGEAAYSVEKTIELIENITLQNHEEFNNKNCFTDMSAAMLIAEMVSFQKKSPQMRNVLVYLGDLTNNGIFKKFLGTVASFDKKVYNFIIVTKPNDRNQWSNEEVKNALALPDNVNIFLREGSHNYLASEQEVLTRFMHAEIEQYEAVKQVYEREFNRLFGFMDIDIAVDFNGYVPFWSCLLASFDGSKIILQHEDMHKEYNKVVSGKKVNKERLQVIFNTYTQYQTIVSRNSKEMEANKQNLELFYGDAKVDDLPSLNKFGKRGAQIASTYVKFYNEDTIESKTILFESFHGKSMVGDPLAIFKAMLNDSQYADYKFIWAMNDLDNVVDRTLLTNKRISFVTVGTYLYKKYLATVQYIINNTSLPPYYVKKEGQIYINTWHGTPYKTLGKHMEGPIGTQTNIVSNFLKSDYLFYASDYTKEKMVNSHDLDGLWNGQELYASPRLDLMCEDVLIKDYLETKMELDLSKETVLYCPTWKGNLTEIGSDFQKLMDEFMLLREELPDKNILLKVHSLMFSRMSEEDRKFVVDDKYDINQVMNYIDVLVTDFSSSFFDFAVLNKKIVHYLDGIEKYIETRGLYLEVNDLPGIKAFSITELVDALKGKDEFIDYSRFNSIYNQQAMSTEDVIKQILKAPTRTVDSRKNILVYAGGFLNNGITKSIINFSYQLDYEKYNLIIIDKSKYNDESSKNIRQLNPLAKVVYRSGSVILSNTEKDIYDDYHENVPDELSDDIKLIMQRELRRMIGDTKIATFIDFSGYVNFWTLIFACAPSGQKLIYQHNNMYLEYFKIVDKERVHEERLNFVFRLYKEFDKVIAVSKETMEVNYENLSHYYTEEQAYYIENYMDADQIFEKTKHITSEDLDLIKKLKDFSDIEKKKARESELYELQNFFNIEDIEMSSKVSYEDPIYLGYFGRISPEKGQIDFIKKLPIIVEAIPNLIVVFCGDGALYEEAQSLTKELCLENNVLFTGHISNPYILMKIFDFVVLFSHSEGQPMVLLEALTVGAKVIASNIPGNRSVLGSDYGQIVEQDANQMIDAIKNYAQLKEFHVYEYNNYITDKYEELLK